MDTAVSGQKHLFIGGLHKSGTSLVSRLLADHPQTSCFANTGAPEDEGQHLQSVYRSARLYGGPGRFGFSPEAHLTDASPLICPANRARLHSEWSRFWDTSRMVLVEKSPPNLISARFLQAMFPNSYFLMVIRHPVAVSLATQKWSRTSLHELMRHWLRCHRIFAMDAPHIRNLLTLRYEDLVCKTQSTMDAIYRFLNLTSHPASDLVEDCNRSYFEQWRSLRANWKTKVYCFGLVEWFEPSLHQYGYSLKHLEKLGAPNLPAHRAL